MMPLDIAPQLTGRAEQPAAASSASRRPGSAPRSAPTPASAHPPCLQLYLRRFCRANNDPVSDRQHAKHATAWARFPLRRAVCLHNHRYTACGLHRRPAFSPVTTDRYDLDNSDVLTGTTVASLRRSGCATSPAALTVVTVGRYCAETPQTHAPIKPLEGRTMCHGAPANHIDVERRLRAPPSW